jgi:predicted extracellular nuclease
MDVDMFKKVLVITFVVIGFTYLTSSRIESASSTIVISEVQIEGVSSSDDFIELYNPTDNDIDLSDYRLVKRSESGTSDSSIKAFGSGDTIPAHGYYLWANSGGSYTDIANSTTGSVISANNGIALRIGDMDTGAIVDSVGWGSAANVFVETSPFAENPGTGSSLERVGDDTDNNSVDFHLREVSDPQGSLSESPTPTPTESPSPTPTPTPTESPTPTPTESPSPSPIPTESPSPSPTPEPVRVTYLASFGTRLCYLRYDHINFGFMRILFPRIVCTSF